MLLTPVKLKVIFIQTKKEYKYEVVNKVRVKLNFRIPRREIHMVIHVSIQTEINYMK